MVPRPGRASIANACREAHGPSPYAPRTCKTTISSDGKIVVWVAVQFRRRAPAFLPPSRRGSRGAGPIRLPARSTMKLPERRHAKRNLAAGAQTEPANTTAFERDLSLTVSESWMPPQKNRHVQLLRREHATHLAEATAATTPRGARYPARRAWRGAPERRPRLARVRSGRPQPPQ